MGVLKREYAQWQHEAQGSRRGAHARIAAETGCAAPK